MTLRSSQNCDDQIGDKDDDTEIDVDPDSDGDDTKLKYNYWSHIDII